MRKTYKYRLYPTRMQGELLTGQLSEACRLYNAALQERRDAWRINQKNISFYDQDAQLKSIRADGDIGIVNHHAAREVLRRVDRAFQAFFRRVKSKTKAGYPRFKSHAHFDSVTYDTGYRLINSRLRLQGVGLIKIKLHRGIEGKIKAVTIKREAACWYACFSVECELQPLPSSIDAVGVDVGLTHFATLSNGVEIDNPRYFKAGQAALRIAQRKVARRKKGSHGRRKAVQLLQRAHAHIKNQRGDFHHKVSRLLVNENGIITVEDLNVKGLAGGMLAKSVADVGWAQFFSFTRYKAENAGREFVEVNPSGTSQECLCGASVLKELKDRWHLCSECGLSAPRDHVSAQLILARGLRVLGITCPVAECVPREAVAV